jgi:chlorophyll synthase
MTRAAFSIGATARPAPAAVLELLKPITWFPPMWAFACGVVSAGVPLQEHWGLALLGILLAGPLLCASSQAVNDWFDRHVDSINEPHRPIPSGRIPGRWGLGIAVAWSALALAVAAALGPWVFGAAAIGVALSWAYSMPPVRLKQNGWWGNAACAVSYEGLAWVTGASVMIGGGLPDWRIVALAALYSAGAHGIMTLNDFKSIDGDRRMGVRSLPVQLGVDNAARTLCIVMVSAQAAVVALLLGWSLPVHAAVVGIVLAAQIVLMTRFLRDPRRFATWFSGFGVLLYVSGMMAAAWGVRLLFTDLA